MKHTLLITGANRGIGLEFVKQYAQQGWRVFACCRQPENAKALSELAKANADISIFPLDVTDEQAIKRLANQLMNESIDILLNNAGVSIDDDENLEHVNSTNWLTTMQVNALAPILMSRAFMAQVGRSDKKIIAMMSSKMGSIQDNQYGMYYSYRASKAALNAMTVSLAIDLKPRNISLVALHPGWVQTDMGGPNATISAQVSVEGLVNVLSKVSINTSGLFLGYDGENIPW
jgi:NAD(P)-dependent dehydrogenase (short-subunit alcohol dehydrogenase family)